MALKDLKSDLSWYGKTSPGPYKTNTGVKDTKFTNDNGIPGASVTGYAPRGNSSVGFRQVVASDGFAITDSSSSSRKAQLGVGTKFPIGPEGQVHEFDTVRTGFHGTNKYSDLYGVKHKHSGLSDTYTLKSPIDDMYNKFKVRDEVHDPYGYAMPPFILRGIQRNDNSDPQNWGGKFGSGVFDIPRGGIVASLDRGLNDALRIGKFLIRPPGISFLVKQFGLQLTNPNVEGIDGTAKTSTFMTKLYDPISSITNAVGGAYGLRTDRHFPPLIRSPLSTYEGVLKARKATGTILEVKNNRLVKIRKELLGADGGGAVGKILKLFGNIAAKVSGRPGETINTLTGLTGPGSLLGIGQTAIRRHITTPDLGDLDSRAGARKDVIDKETGKTTSTDNIDYQDASAYNVTIARSHAQLNHTSFKDKIEGEDVKYIHPMAGDANGIGGGNGYEIKKPWDTKNFTDKTNLHNYTDEEPYLSKKGNDKSINTSGATHQSGIEEKDVSLKNKYTNWNDVAPDRGGRGIAGDGGAGGGVSEAAEGSIINDYKRMAYGDIPTRTAKLGNKDARVSDHTDFREIVGGKSEAGKKRWAEDTKIDVIDSKIDTSLINFKIAGIKFKAYLGGVNDSFAGSWNGQADQGRADARYLYESFERTVTMDFIVPIESKKDYGTVWGNLQSLAQKTYPVYGTNGFHGQTVNVTVGDLFKNQPMIITDLSYDWDNETPWEITEGEQSPMYTNVSISFTVLGSKPTSGTKVYKMKGMK